MLLWSSVSSLVALILALAVALGSGSTHSKAKTLPKAESIFDVGLPEGVSPSGLVWHNNRLYVVDDNGALYALDENGKYLNKYGLAGADAEAVTAVPSRPDYVYVGVESDENNSMRPVILEVNTRTKKTERTFKIPKGFPASASAGLESLTFVPDAKAPNGLGYFLGGSQGWGAKVFVYDIKVDSSNKRETVRQLAKFKAPVGTYDLSDMEYQEGKLYFLFDSEQLLVRVDAKPFLDAVMNSDGDEPVDYPGLITYRTGGANYEGFTLNENYVFIGDDSGDLLRWKRKEFEEGMVSS